MYLTHELAGFFIVFLGLMFILLANPMLRQVQRLHMHSIELLEPGVITFLARGMGVVLVLLGLVTLANMG